MNYEYNAVMKAADVARCRTASKLTLMTYRLRPQENLTGMD